MKKAIMILALCVAASAYSDVNVNWGASAGFYWNATSAALLGAAGSGNSTIAKLYYSSDATKSDIGVNGAVSGGNDILWATTTITEGAGSTEWADFPA